MDRSEQVGSLSQIVTRELEERGLDRSPRIGGLVDRLVVPVAPTDRLIVDRRVRREPGDRELVDVALERPFREHVAGDVVEPDALAQVAESLDRSRHALLTSLGPAAAPTSVGAS